MDKHKLGHGQPSLSFHRCSQFQSIEQWLGLNYIYESRLYYRHRHKLISEAGMSHFMALLKFAGIMIVLSSCGRESDQERIESSGMEGLGESIELNQDMSGTSESNGGQVIMKEFVFKVNSETEAVMHFDNYSVVGKRCNSGSQPQPGFLLEGVGENSDLNGYWLHYPLERPQDYRFFCKGIGISLRPGIYQLKFRIDPMGCESVSWALRMNGFKVDR